MARVSDLTRKVLETPPSVRERREPIPVHRQTTKVQVHTRARTTLLSRLLTAKRGLDRLYIGHGTSHYNLHVGEPQVVTREQRDSLAAAGVNFCDMLAMATAFYTASLDDPNLVTLLGESSLSQKATEVQRRTHRELGHVPLPSFFRADMLDLDTAVELNVPGGGQGITHALTDRFTSRTPIGIGLAQGYAQALRQLTGKEKPVVYFPEHNIKVTGHVHYFTRVLRQYGIDARTYRWNESLPSPDSCDVVVRFGLNFSVKRPGWDDLFKAYLNGRVIIEPAPTAIYDSKIPEVLAYHPETRDHFSDAVRAVFPKTYLVEPSLEVPTVVAGQPVVVPIGDLPYISARGRRFVLKYAGSGINRSSAMGVFQLDGKRTGKDGAEDLIEKALEDAQRGEFWLLQERLKVPYKVKYLDELTQKVLEAQMRARIMPTYTTVGGVQLVEATGLYSTNWKVHGNSQSVHCAMHVL